MGACRAIRCGGPVGTISQGSVSDQNSTRASCHGVSLEDAVVDRGCGNDSNTCQMHGSWHRLAPFLLSLFSKPGGPWSVLSETLPDVTEVAGNLAGLYSNCVALGDMSLNGDKVTKVSHDDHSGFCLETAVIEAGVASVRRHGSSVYLCLLASLSGQGEGDGSLIKAPEKLAVSSNFCVHF